MIKGIFMGKGHSNLYSLGLMRVFASLMVVIYHFDNMVTVKYGHSTFGDTFNLGIIGVNYFFVLSGFLLYQIHRKEWGKPKHAMHYAAKRVARIFPLYWVALIATILLSQLSSTPKTPVGIDWFYEFALIKPEGKRVLGVSWTLNLDMLYYVIFCFTILLPIWAGKTIMFTWLLLVVAANLLIGTTHDALGSYALLFMSGCFLSHSFSMLKNINFSRLFLLLIGVFGLIVLLGIGYYKEYQDISRLCERTAFSIGFFMFLGALLLWEVQKGVGFMSHPFIVMLADATYSIYLFHIMVGLVIFKITLATGMDEIMNRSFMLTIFIVIAIVMGVVIQKTIEAPLTKKVKPLVDLFNPKRKLYSQKKA
jgi:peptidoglycan/LPS O-acetylase OafA/YrhL|tara:strand:- start:3717 stop:4811 length:1095 start_codon:yes stop_codon:yes gene_type:complete